MSAPMRRTAELEGGRVASYEVSGEGDALLWFHGGPGLPAWLSRPTAKLLGDAFSVYLIDPHGSGGSTPPADAIDYDAQGHARFYDEVRRALGLERVTVGGISFGGTVALTYAALFPDVVARCIAASAGGFGPELDEGDAAAETERAIARHAGAPWFADAKKTWDTWTERALAAEDGAEVEEMLRTVAPLYFAHPDRPDVRAHIERESRELEVDLGAVKAWEGGIFQTFDVRSLLPQVRCPTLVIAGELDLICGPAQARRIAEGVTDGKLVLVPDCGHMVPLEAPDVFRREVLEWCAETAASRL